MKKKNYIIWLFFLFSIFMIKTEAAIPVGGNRMDYSTCMAFSDRFKTIGINEGSYYYRYCYRANCSYNVYNLANMVGNSAFRCQNGNYSPYRKVTSDGCKNYTGTCGAPNVDYCTKVEFVDCNKTSTGSPYGNPTTTTQRQVAPITTTTTTTKRKTTTKATTRKTTKRAVIPKTTTTTTTIVITTTTTTTKATNDNTNINTIKLNGLDINYVNTKDKYSAKLPYGVDNIEVEVVPEDPKTTYSVTGNKDMPDEDSKITIDVTASDGTKKKITINITRYEPELYDCSLDNIFIEDFNLDFLSSKNNYVLTIPKKVNSLDIKLVPHEENSKTEIIGNEKLENKSKILINVYSEDGNKCEYKITIKKESNLWKYIVLIVLLTSALGIAFYFLRKSLRKSKGKYKYE